MSTTILTEQVVISRRPDDLSAVEAARRLDIDLNRLYILLRLGRLAGHKVNGKWRVSISALEQRLRSGRRTRFIEEGRK